MYLGFEGLGMSGYQGLCVFNDPRAVGSWSFGLGLGSKVEGLGLSV